MSHYRKVHGGSSLIEVLVAIIILMLGLLGMAGLQMKALTTQMESYQRSQALVLLKDMADRIDANRKNAASYVATVGTGATCPAVGATVASADLNQWCNALQGAAEADSGGGSVGAMIGARGCISQTVAPATGAPARYLIAVEWQGLNSTAEPTIKCGAAGVYGSDETKRRVVALPINIADLL